jgi:hypothetical protein
MPKEESKFMPGQFQHLNAQRSLRRVVFLVRRRFLLIRFLKRFFRVDGREQGVFADAGQRFALPAEADGRRRVGGEWSRSQLKINMNYLGYSHAFHC